MSSAYLILDKSNMTCFVPIQCHKVKISWGKGCSQSHLEITTDEAEYIPQNIKNAFNVNIDFSIQLCKTLVTLSATCCNFFLKIYNSNYFQFYSHSTEKFAILSYTAIFVNSNFSQHHCMWNDILLTNFVLSFHTYSQLSDWKLCLKN